MVAGGAAKVPILNPISGSPMVINKAVSNGSLLPRPSVTILVSGKKRSRVNLASMLANTIELFVAQNDRKAPRRHCTGSASRNDAGAKKYDELCAHSPLHSA